MNAARCRSSHDPIAWIASNAPMVQSGRIAPMQSGGGGGEAWVLRVRLSQTRKSQCFARVCPKVAC